MYAARGGADTSFSRISRIYRFHYWAWSFAAASSASIVKCSTEIHDTLQSKHQSSFQLDVKRHRHFIRIEFHTKAPMTLIYPSLHNSPSLLSTNLPNRNAEFPPITPNFVFTHLLLRHSIRLLRRRIQRCAPWPGRPEWGSTRSRLRIRCRNNRWRTPRRCLSHQVPLEHESGEEFQV